MSIFETMGWSAKGQEGSGASVGNAQGRFTVDTSAFAQARQDILREARQMNAAIKSSLSDVAKTAVGQSREEIKAYNDNLRSLKRTYQERAREERLLTRQLEKEARERLRIEQAAEKERQRIAAQRMTAIGGAAVATTGVGLSSAQNVKQLRAQFQLFYGEEKKANAEMERLRDLAQELNQPFLEVLQNATELIPAVKGTTAELAQATVLSQKLAVLLPEMANRAGFALREFSVGQYMSLTRVFNLNREKLKEILDQTQGDVGAAFALLDDYLSELGVTTKRLADVSRETNAFKVMRSEMQETLATGFMPMRDALSDIVWQLSDMLRAVREVHPELLKLAAVLTTIVAVSQSGRVAGAIPVVGQFTKGMGLPAVSGGTLLKAGAYGAVGAGSVYAGAWMGKQITKGIGYTTGREDLQKYSFDDTVRTIKQGLLAVAYVIASLVTRIGDAIEGWDATWTKLEQTLVDSVTSVINAIVGLVNNIPGVNLEKLHPVNVAETKALEQTQAAANKFLALPESIQAQVTQWAEARGMEVRDVLLGIDQIVDAYKTATAQGKNFIGILDETYNENTISDAGQLHQRMNDLLLELAESMDLIEPKITTGLSGRVGMPYTPPTSGIQITDELLKEWQQFQQDLFDITVKTDEEIRDLTLEHNAQLLDLNEQLAEDIAELQAEENARYLEALQEARDQEAEIRAELAEDLARDDADLADKLADLNKDYQEDEQKATEDHIKALKRIQEDGRLELLRAAMRLDGIAVWEALQNMKKRTKDEEENYAEEREQRKKRYDERLSDELKAHQKSDLLARQAADKKIKDLWADFQKENTARAQDYAKKLADLQKSHVDQQAELGKQYTQRLNQLIAQGAAEKAQKEQAFIDAFNAIEEEAGVHESKLLSIHQGGNAAIENQLILWYNGMVAKFAAASGTTPSAPDIGALLGAPMKQGGGRLWTDGLIQAEAGETVLRQDTTRQISAMLGSNWTPAALVSALGKDGGGGGKRVTVSTLNMPVNIYGETRRTDAEIENLVRHELVQVFAEI